MKNAENSLLLINKPSGPTSHDIISRLRKLTGIKKIGHAGTLDPFASGLLLCAVGRETTKEIGKFFKLDKEYIATLHLGATSDTHDRTGKIIDSRVVKPKTEEEVKKIALSFIGQQEQTPPMFSAKKINGQKMYVLARQGKVVERRPCSISIYSLEILSYIWPKLIFKINCSSGTYIRVVAYDFGQRLGCGAYLEELERTKIGEFNVKEAIRL